MEYRGKHFIVARWIEPDTWKWTVYIDEIASISGEAGILASAVSAVVLLVDKKLSRSFVRPNEKGFCRLAMRKFEEIDPSLVP